MRASLYMWILPCLVGAGCTDVGGPRVKVDSISSSPSGARVYQFLKPDWDSGRAKAAMRVPDDLAGYRVGGSAVTPMKQVMLDSRTSVLWARLPDGSYSGYADVQPREHDALELPLEKR